MIVELILTNHIIPSGAVKTPAGGNMFGEKEARKVCQQVLSQCSGLGAGVLVIAEDVALTHFSNCSVHESVVERKVSVILQIFRGKRRGTATTHRLEGEALTQLVARARTDAETNPEDLDHPELPEPAVYAAVQAFDAETADYPAEKRREMAEKACTLAVSQGMAAAGGFLTGSGALYIANSRGLFACHTSTNADFQMRAVSPDSSGWAHASGQSAKDISVAALAREAVEKARQGRNPRQVEPGVYPVILEPYAVEDLLQMLNYHGMSAMDVYEGRSWMNEMLGEKAMDTRVSIWDDGLDTEGMPMPFDFEGVPKQLVEIVQNGVVMGPVYDRYTAGIMGKTSSGHAMPPSFRGKGPLATNLFMAGGDATVEEMIASTERGLYITRFWYTRLARLKGCEVAGATHDGVFWIENGKIAYPVQDLRFSQSYVEALKGVQMVGKERRLLASEFGGMAMRVPALKIREFHFTGAAT
jgi:PmbA protein